MTWHHLSPKKEGMGLNIDGHSKDPNKKSKDFSSMSILLLYPYNRLIIKKNLGAYMECYRS
jgi:hypothetical protein